VEDTAAAAGSQPFPRRSTGRTGGGAGLWAVVPGSAVLSGKGLACVSGGRKRTVAPDVSLLLGLGRVGFRTPLRVHGEAVGWGFGEAPNQRDERGRPKSCSRWLLGTFVSAPPRHPPATGDEPVRDTRTGHVDQTPPSYQQATVASRGLASPGPDHRVSSLRVATGRPALLAGVVRPGARAGYSGTNIKGGRPEGLGSPGHPRPHHRSSETVRRAKPDWRPLAFPAGTSLASSLKRTS
jgi:hypothetical protein